MQDLKEYVIASSGAHFVCEPMLDGEAAPEFLNSLVVAWVVSTWDHKSPYYGEPKSMAMPVIVESTLPEEYFIKHPDGTYELPDDRFNMTHDEALSYAVELWGDKK